MSFFASLRRASFGGVPFGVLAGDGHFGRRQAVHEYPFRDTPWVEDLGRSARRINVIGFIVEDDKISGGADVIIQRDRLLEVAESSAQATLVHPTYGTMQVALLEISVSEKWDEGCYFEIAFSFIQAGERTMPSIIVATTAMVKKKASSAYSASIFDYALAAVRLVHLSSSLIKTAIYTVKTWTKIVKNVVNDATSLIGMVSELAGTQTDYGRYAGGGTTGFTGSAKTLATKTTSELIAAGSASRSAVEIAAAKLATLAASGMGADPVMAKKAAADIGEAAQGLTDAILSAMADPADAVRLFPTLADFIPATYYPPSVIGNARKAFETAMANLFRRCAVIALAKASASYQPSSSDDAVAVRRSVVALLDREIVVAGDNGDDSTFNAFRELRQAVVIDLNTRGAALPALKTVTFQASLPAAVVSLRLYRDAGRADEISRETGAPHPAFQTLSMKVLAS